MVAEVVRGKALALIVESATVVDESGNHVELKNLRPDGTIGEPEPEAPEFADYASSESTDAGEAEAEAADETEASDED
jgi:trigger factor